MRDAGLGAIGRLALEQARQHKASFVGFDYLDSDQAGYAGWPDAFSVLKLSEPSTRLDITWRDFESYLEHQPKSAKKDYRRHHNRALDLGIQVKRHSSVADLDGAIRLIRNVEAHHKAAPVPWARAMLEKAGLAEAVWLTAEMDGRTAACGLLLADGPHAVMRLLGRDYQAQYAYFQLVYEVIRCAIEKNVEVLWGAAALTT